MSERAEFRLHDRDSLLCAYYDAAEAVGEAAIAWRTALARAHGPEGANADYLDAKLAEHTIEAAKQRCELYRIALLTLPQALELARSREV